MQLHNQKNDRLYRAAVQDRKARTRTLIQLGGLMEKAGLLDCVDLTLGEDLQKDPETQDGVATLFGALLAIKQELHSPDRDAFKLIWKERGKKGLRT